MKKQSKHKVSLNFQDILSKRAWLVESEGTTKVKIAIITECIKNQQTKNLLFFFSPYQKHAKKIETSTESNLSQNECTVTNNDTFEMFDIPINIKRCTVEAIIWRCSVKKVLLKILQNSPENTFKIGFKKFENRFQHSGVFL